MQEKNENIPLRTQYIDSIMHLIKQENIDIDRDRLRDVLSRYSLEEVDRIFDAFTRFGVKTILENI